MGPSLGVQQSALSPNQLPISVGAGLHTDDAAELGRTVVPLTEVVGYLVWVHQSRAQAAKQSETERHFP